MNITLSPTVNWMLQGPVPGQIGAVSKSTFWVHLVLSGNKPEPRKIRVAQPCGQVDKVLGAPRSLRDRDLDLEITLGCAGAERGEAQGKGRRMRVRARGWERKKGRENRCNR